MKKTLILLTASLGLAAAPGARADVILFDNLGNSPIYYISVASPLVYFQEFRTDAQSYTLNSVTMLLSGYGSCPFTAGIYSGTPLPTTLVGTLTTTETLAIYPSLGPTAFTAAPGLVLEPNSTYWVGMGAPSSSAPLWLCTAELSGTGAGFAVGFATTDGDTWFGGARQDYGFQMQVDASPSSVPEPGQWAMMGLTLLGVGGFGFRQWRNRRGQ